MIQRTEVQVAADTVAAILESGHVKKTGAMVAALSKAAGLRIGDVHLAWQRYVDGKWQPPREAVAPVATSRDSFEHDNDEAFEVMDKPCPVCGAPVEHRVGARGRRPIFCSRVCQRRNRNLNNPVSRPRARVAHNRTPETQVRVCGRCGNAKPIEEFPVRSDHGTRRSWCGSCLKEYQRARYFSIQKQRIVAKLMEGDACVGSRCPRCRQPFEVGQLVVAGGMRHEECSAVSESNGNGAAEHLGLALTKVDA